MTDASTYLLIFGVDRRDGAIDLMPSVRMNADAVPPAQLRRHRLAAGSCTVFRHVLRKGDIYPQVNAAREAILKGYLSRPSVRAPRPFLEVFPQGLAVTAGSWVDHYFPTEESST